MHPNHFSGYLTSESVRLSSLRQNTTDLCLPEALPTRYIAAYGPTGVLPVQHNWNPLPGHGLPRSTPNSAWVFSRPQHAYHSFAKKATQSIQSHYASQVSQVPYRPVRHQAAPGTIEFVVNGERGIRLFDVLEDNWAGFEGRDDRSLFEGNRLQITLRFQPAGCSPWQSKINAADFTAKRRPISRMKLAAEVAKSMKKFIAREKLNGHNVAYPRCGWGDVSLKNIFLMRLVRVSVASWQPEIFVEQPPVSPQVVASSSSSSSPLA